MLISVKLLTKCGIIIYALGSVHEKFGVWIKAVPKPLKGKIPGRARRKERLSCSKLKQAFLIDSDTELFMYLIQYIRFGSWKVWRLNRALQLPRLFIPWLLLLRHRNYRKSYYDDYSRDKEYYSKDRHRDSNGSGYGYRSRSRSYSPRKWILYSNNNITLNLFFSFLMLAK